MSVRWLVNENFPAPSIIVLRAAGHDVLSIAESYSGVADTEVLSLARKDNRWLVTFDRDYGELLFARNLTPPPAVILLRVPSYRPDEPAAWLELLLDQESLIDKFTVFTGKTLRSRPLLHRVEI
jgi:predicted nuclease of predicted toxin-antitoxin system